MIDPDEATDWAAWSRESVALLQARNTEWINRFDLADAPYHWDLDSATLIFQRQTDEVLATVCVVGTTSVHEGTFLWAWANESIPPHAQVGLERVRAFGEENDLGLLVDPEMDGGRAEALEMLAVAARVMDSDGVFIDGSGDVAIFFALSQFRTR